RSPRARDRGPRRRRLRATLAERLHERLVVGVGWRPEGQGGGQGGGAERGGGTGVRLCGGACPEKTPGQRSNEHAPVHETLPSRPRRERRAAGRHESTLGFALSTTLIFREIRAEKRRRVLPTPGRSRYRVRGASRDPSARP